MNAYASSGGVAKAKFEAYVLAASTALVLAAG